MIDIDKIILEWSYRIEDGIPDLADPYKVQKLREAFKSLGYSDEFISEYVSNIRKISIGELLVEGSTAATTLYHEVISGIAAVDSSVSVNNFATGADVAKYFDNGIIEAVAGSKIPSYKDVMTLPQAKFLTAKDKDGKPQIPNPKVVADAISSGKKVADQLPFTPSPPAYWSGPTNDKSDFGAADIILSDGSISSDKAVGVSLKFGKGQLKNLTGNKFLSAIIDLEGKGSLMKAIHEINGDAFNEMTKTYVGLIKKTVDNTKNQDAMNAFNGIKGNIETWATYQKGKITSKEAADLVKGFPDLDAAKIAKGGTKYFGRKMAESSLFPSSWAKDRTDYFSIFFGMFLDRYADKIEKNLGTLFERQLSITTKPFWYSASGGTDLKLIPGKEQFDALVKTLQFDYKHGIKGDGYIFDLSIKDSNAKTLGDIAITLRWKQGQMVGYPNTTSTGKWHIDNKEWGKIFN